MIDGLLTFQKHMKRWTELPTNVQSRESYLSQGMMEHTHNRPKKPCKIWGYFAGFFWPVVINER